MKVDSMFPSSFMKAKDVPRAGLTLTIAKIVAGQLADRKSGEVKTVYSLFFTEEDIKPLTLNRSNAAALQAWYGNETDDWIGKPVHIVRMLGLSFGKQAWLVAIEPPDEATDNEGEPEETPEIPF